MQIVVLIFFLSWPLISVSEGVQKGKTVIRAEQLEWIPQEGCYLLRQGVSLRRDAIRIEASEVRYCPETGTVKAMGEVYYEDDRVVIRAEDAMVDLVNERGELRDARIFFKRDEYWIEARKVKRIDKETYILKDLAFTTCDGEGVKDWCFTGREAKVVEGDSLRARGVAFRIKGLPVLYSPYLWAPVVKERKSGLLMPDVGFNSEKGFHWRQPLYLVISENRDVTLFFETYTRRAVGEGLEYRYVERWGEGRWWIYHLRDWDLQRDFFELSGGHRYNSPGLSGFINMNLLNRREFYRIYSYKLQLWGKRFTESTAEVSLKRPWGRIYAEARFWQDTTDAGTGEIPQRIPVLGLTVYPFRTGPLYVTASARAGYYYAEDLFRTGRLQIYPRVYLSLGESFTLLQEVGYRGDYYHLEETDPSRGSFMRHTLLSETALQTRLYRRYGHLLGILEPELRYSFVSNAEGEPPVLDSSEVYQDVSLLEASLRTWFYRDGGLLGGFRLTASYDTERSDQRGLRLQTTLHTPISVQTDLFYSFRRRGFESFNYSLGLRLQKIELRFGQRYNRETELHAYTGSIGIKAWKRVNLEGSVWYDARGEGLQNLVIRSRYRKKCWWIDLSFSKRPDEYLVMLTIGLKGLGELRLGG